MPAPDVLVIGGGVVGAACAEALSGAGARVRVLDAGSTTGAATPASAGMLAPLIEASADDPLLNLSVRARDLCMERAPALEAETGVHLDLWTGGVVHVVTTEQQAEVARDRVAWQRQSGLATDWLPAEDVQARIPGVATEVVGGVLAPEDGSIDPVSLHQALVALARQRGVEFEDTTSATRIYTAGSIVAGVETSAGRIDAGAVVIAAGCWSGRIAGLPRPLSVEPIRGQMAALPWPRGLPRCVVYGPGGYVLQRGNELLAGATMEYVGFDPSVTEDGISSVVEAAARLFPSIDRSRVLRSWAGLRPMTPDGAPFLGRDPAISNLYHASGHGRNGILLALLTGQIITSLWQGASTDLDLSAVDPGRFWM